MNNHTPDQTTADDQPVLDALKESDPADAPDIAEGLAAGLQRELDETGSAPVKTPENDPDTQTP